MKLLKTPLTVLRYQYQIARLPLQLIETRVAARFDAEEPARLLYERSFGALDALAGRLLGDGELRRRGAALMRRSDVLTRASQLDAAAERTRDEADAKLQATQDDVVSDINQARNASEQQAVAARRAAQKHKENIEEEAERREVAVKAQVDKAAAARINDIEETHRSEDAAIRAATRTVNRTADAKLEDARTKRGEAASDYQAADRLEELADAEQEKRRSQRAKT